MKSIWTENKGDILENETLLKQEEPLPIHFPQFTVQIKMISKGKRHRKIESMFVKRKIFS